VSTRTGASDRCTCGLATRGRLDAYNEEAFWYLLRVERRRSERSRRPFLLVLVVLQNEPGARVRIPQPFVDRMFSGLFRVLRETDVIGWYREGQIAGAVLSGQGDGGLTDIPARITGRLTNALSHGLPAPASQQLQVRVYQIQPTLAN
jgi:hypothetical protein